MPSPIVQFGNLIQTNMWKMASAFYHLKAWEGKLNIKDGKFTLSFRFDQSYPFMACVPLPYLLLKGPVQRHSNYSIASEHCTLHSVLILVCF